MRLLTTAARLGALIMLVVLPLAPVQASSQQCGKASWYALHSQTASGQMMNPNAMTAAHRSLPFGSKVRVTNTANGRAVTVTINDRGPFIKGRIIDLSRAAAGALGFQQAGVTSVCVVTL